MMKVTRCLRLLLVPLLTLVALATGGAWPATAAGDGPPTCQVGCATAFVVPDVTVEGAGEPFGITQGSRGSIWFSLYDALGRIDHKGMITTYQVPTPGAAVGWLATAPEGAVWFAERDGNKVGRITAKGAITEYPLPSPDAGPQGIVFGPDSNVYVTEQGADAIAQLTPTTGQVREFLVPTPDSGPLGLALGPDGALWFIERSAAKVGRMTLAGTFTEYPLAPGTFANRIVAAPDGALWFTELRPSNIARITTTGVLTEFPIAGGPVGITLGKDGQLYVALTAGHGVARVNLSGQETGRWDLPGSTIPLQITTGFGLDLWVTDAVATPTLTGKLYRVTPYTVGRGHAQG